MRIIAEYIWLGGKYELRSKGRVLEMDRTKALNISNLPVWNYDGSSTGQASGSNSEIMLHPVAVFPCPFRRKNDIIVLCQTRNPDGTATQTNHYEWAKSIFDQCLEEEPWFGIEQEYFLMDPKTGKPLGFPSQGHPNSQGQYYCSVGAENAFGRTIVEEHMQACIDSGITISGVNAEVAIGQWEYQIGPCTGIDSGNHLVISRYLLERVAENHGVSICWEPKPIGGDWNGSGCHTNYSTKKMREGDPNKEGLDYIHSAISCLKSRHAEHMKVYGEGNRDRMTGEHETASFDVFTSGNADRSASVRIGTETVRDKKGYFEDRRPSSNMDPYLVTGIIVETTVLLAGKKNDEKTHNEKKKNST